MANDLFKEKEEHPAFGTITTSYVSGRAHLFGSDAEHQHFIEIRVQHAERFRNLSQDWVHAAAQPSIVYWMTEAAWQHHISSHGKGEGTPVTLRYVNGEGRLPEIPAPKRDTSKFSNEVGKTVNEAVGTLKGLAARFKAGLEPNAKLPGKSELRDMMREMECAIGQVVNGLPYIEKTFNEHMERRMHDALIEFEGYLNRTLKEKGLEAVRNEFPTLTPVPVDEHDETAEAVARARQNKRAR